MSNDLPVAAVAAFFEACDYLSEVGLSAVLADEAVFDMDDEVHMFRHHDIVLDLNDGIMLGYAVQEFVLHHLSDSGEFYRGGVGMAVRILYVSDDSA